MVSIKGCRGFHPLMNYNDGLDELPYLLDYKLISAISRDPKL